MADNTNRSGPTRSAGMGQPVQQTAIRRWREAFAYALTGKGPDIWFSPMEPIQPAVPDAQKEQAGVAGRRLDFPVGFNTNIRPRAYEGIKFEHLRALADNYDVLRLVIETRKDQVCEYPWQVQYREVNGVRKKPDAATQQAELLLRKPDGQNRWKGWLRLLLEDLFVLDAPALYVRQTLAGGIFGFEPVDGATIAPKIDATGRQPMEGTAYQQVLKGVPAVDYTRQELIYMPRNIRTHKVYGYSPVEQIVNTVNIGLRRQQFTLDYFTTGSVPDALAGVPETWTTDQIGAFQLYWDALLASEDGSMAQRRRLRFVPGEIARNFKETKAPPLKDEFDEWLARIVCYCFGVEPTPFTKQVNRATAETAREQSLMEGLGPTLSWTKEVADELLERTGHPDMELTWQEGKIIDAEVRMKVMTGYVAAKVMHPDEVRERELGLDPLTPEQKEELNPTPVLPGEDGEAPPGKKPPPSKKPDDSAKGAYLGKALRRGPAKASAQKKLAARTKAFLSKKAAEYAAQLARYLELGKAAHMRPKINDAIDALNWDWSDMAAETEPLLAQVAVAGAAEALAQVTTLTDKALENVRSQATEWAHDRAAEMVGMRWQHDKLVPNPDAKWQITDATRETLRDLSEQALDEGWSAQRLASEIEEASEFSAERALRVARTEIAKADTQGALLGYKASGVVSGKRWQTAEDDKVAPECVANQEAGVVPLDDLFPSGEEAPPNHPNCRCVVLPVLTDEDEGE